MLEIIILYHLCRRIGKLARAKERRATGYQLLLLLFWFVGEFLGAFLACMSVWTEDGIPADKKLYVYGAGLFGAVAGAWSAFRIVRSLPAPDPEAAIPTTNWPSPSR